jgi:hypothetical protein
VLARFIDSAPVTGPYLQKLITIMERENVSETSEWRGMWGRAADRLKGWARRIDANDLYEVPPTLGDLIQDLEARQMLEPEQIHQLRDLAPTPTKAKPKPTVTFYDAWRQLETLTGKSVVFDGRLEALEDAAERTLAIVAGLKKLKPAAKRAFETLVRKIYLGTKGYGSEDASWRLNQQLDLLVKAHPPSVWAKIITHELGHGVEEHHRVNLFEPPWGLPPFISDYAATKPSEDFAESYAEYVISPATLKAQCPAKWAALKALI